MILVCFRFCELGLFILLFWDLVLGVFYFTDFGDFEDVGCCKPELLWSLLIWVVLAGWVFREFWYFHGLNLFSDCSD